MKSGKSSNAAALLLGLGVRARRERLVIAHEGDEGEELPKILQEAQIESLQFCIHPARDEKNHELNCAQQQKRPEREPCQQRKAERVEKPHDRKGGLGSRLRDRRAVGGM